MSKNRRYITAGGTLLCALGIGFFMQSGGDHADTTRTAATVQQAASGDVPGAPAVDGAGQDTLELSEVTLTSAIPVAPRAATDLQVLPALPEAKVHKAALTTDPMTELPKEELAPSFECKQTLEARPVAAAMVNLSLRAPCMANERFTLHHNGMMFTGVTDADGNSRLTVPALSQQAVFIVAFAHGDGAVATADVTSLEYYDRMVVQWKGHSGLQLHALEYGADYGQEGHVWAGAARDLSVAAKGEGGFVTRLGEADLPEALLAEVYTFPSGTAAREGNVAVSVEAEVTDRNCGLDVEAQSIQISRAGRPIVQDLVLAIPDCNAIGDFLVLKNMLNDLKIARN